MIAIAVAPSIVLLGLEIELAKLAVMALVGMAQSAAAPLVPLLVLTMLSTGLFVVFALAVGSSRSAWQRVGPAERRQLDRGREESGTSRHLRSAPKPKG